MTAPSPVVHSFWDVPDYLRKIQTYPNIGWIYRGQSDASWPLLPKAGRPEYFDPEWQRDDGDRPARDLGRFNAWRADAIAYCSELPEDDYECLVFAQHYGLATRLLDWTTNPLVALYFAAEGAQDSDGAVHCYLPWTCLKQDNRIPFDQVLRVVRYDPRPFDRRILVQASCFTFHPQPEERLVPGAPDPEAARIAPDGCDLVAFIVTAKAKSTILRQLSDIGVSRRSLFPDLEGLSYFINWGTRRSVAWKAEKKNPAGSGE